MSKSKPSPSDRVEKFLRQYGWLIAIMALAIFFRFWRLNHLPPGLYEDEAANGLDVFRILGGQLQPFYLANGGREALFFYLQTPFVWALGNSALALRLAPALIGTATVGATYLWVKSWFSKQTALLSALFVATGSWAVTISRIGFRAGLVPLFIALNGWLATKAIRTKRWYWAALAGVSFGGGLYTYFSYRALAASLLAILVFAAVKHRAELKAQAKTILIAAGCGLLILVPLGIYALDHRAEVLGARGEVSFTNPAINNGQPLQTLGKTLLKTAGMFNLTGDHNYRHNLSGEPMLGAIVGVFFALGLLLSLRRIGDIRYFSLLAVFGGMLLPEVVTAEGIPHSLRAIGVIPVVYILAAIGLREMMIRFKAVFPKNLGARLGLYLMCGAILGLSVFYSYQRYFVAYGNDPKTYEQFSEDAAAIGSYMATHPGRQYYVVDDEDKDRTVAYLSHNYATYQRISPDQLSRLAMSDQVTLLIAEDQIGSAEPYLQNLLSEFKLTQTNVASEARPLVTLYRIYENKTQQ